MSWLGLRNQVYSIVNVTGQHIYSYRDTFPVVLQSKVSESMFSQLEGYLVQAWKSTVAGRQFFIFHIN